MLMSQLTWCLRTHRLTIACADALAGLRTLRFCLYIVVLTASPLLKMNNWVLNVAHIPYFGKKSGYDHASSRK